MKTRSFLFCALLLTTTIATAQLKLGFKGGISTFSVSDESISILNQDGREEFALLLQEADYGYHFGLWTQIKLGNFIIRPELLFNSNSVDFGIFDEDDPDIVGQVFSEKYQYLDIPIMVGITAGPLRFNAGPVGHVFLNSVSDLIRFDDYDENFRALTVGWQGGLGLDVWKLTFDLRYEGNLNQFGDHIRFFGRDYSFSDRPSRIIASLGFEF